MQINNFIKEKLLCLGTITFLMLPLTCIRAQETTAQESAGITPAPIYENKNLKKFQNPNPPEPPELPDLQEKPSQLEAEALPPPKLEEKPYEATPQNPPSTENPKPQVKKEIKKAKPIKKTPSENTPTPTQEASNNSTQNSDITQNKTTTPDNTNNDPQEKSQPQAQEKDQTLVLPEVTDSEIPLYNNSLIETPENNTRHKNIIQTLGAWLLITAGLLLIIKGVVESKKNSKNHKPYKQNFHKFNSQFRS